MRRATLLAVAALAWTACGDAPEPETFDPSEREWSFDDPQSDDSANRDPMEGVRATPPDVSVPSVTPAPVGTWVRSLIGNCTDLEEWLVLAADGRLEHAVADRNACAEGSLARHVGHWSTDGPLAKMRWSNATEASTREATLLVDGDVMRVGVFAGFGESFRKIDAIETRRGTRYETSDIRAELVFQDLELVDGDRCLMTATINATVGNSAGAETFDFECEVRQMDGRWQVSADGFEASDAWLEYFEEVGIWDRHPAPVANAMYRAFRPRLYTKTGGAYWNETHDSVYRGTEQSPPVSMSDLERD